MLCDGFLLGVALFGVQPEFVVILVDELNSPFYGNGSAEFRLLTVSFVPV